MPLALYTSTDRKRERQDNKLCDSNPFAVYAVQGAQSGSRGSGAGNKPGSPFQAALGRRASLPQILPLHCSCQYQQSRELRCSSLHLSNTISWVFEVPRCNPTCSPGIMAPAWVIFPVTFQFFPQNERDCEYCSSFTLHYIIVLNLLSIEIISLWMICLLGWKPPGFVRYYKKSGVHFPGARYWNTYQVFLPLTINGLALLVLWYSAITGWYFFVCMYQFNVSSQRTVACPQWQALAHKCFPFVLFLALTTIAVCQS